MGKRAFLGNVIGWGLVLVACAAFQAWYRTGDYYAVYASVQSSRFTQVFTVFSGVLLLFAIGAVGGCVLVRLRDIRLSRMPRLVMRVISVALGLLFVAAVAPVLMGFDTNIFTVLMAFAGMAAGPVFTALGVVYALGFAGEKPEAAVAEADDEAF